MTEYRISLRYDPIGLPLKLADGQTLVYDMRTDSWIPFELTPFDDFTPVSEAEALLTAYKRRVAEFLTHFYNSDYFRGKAFAHVVAEADYIEEAFVRNEDPEDVAIDVGYACG